MSTNLQRYSALEHTSTANVAQILDPRFSNDTIRDSDVLRSFTPVVPREEYGHCLEDKVQSRSFLDKLLEEDSIGCLRVVGHDEILSFSRATAVTDRKATPLP